MRLFGMVTIMEKNHTINVSKAGRKRILNQNDELLLTLMKLRLGLLNKDLADRFTVSETTVSTIFTTYRSPLG